MRHWLVLAPLLPLAAVAQLALLPGWLPPMLRPDLGLLIGLAGMVFLPAEAALAAGPFDPALPGGESFDAFSPRSFTRSWLVLRPWSPL